MTDKQKRMLDGLALFARAAWECPISERPDGPMGDFLHQLAGLVLDLHEDVRASAQPREEEHAYPDVGPEFWKVVCGESPAHPSSEPAGEVLQQRDAARAELERVKVALAGRDGLLEHLRNSAQLQPCQSLIEMIDAELATDHAEQPTAPARPGDENHCTCGVPLNSVDKSCARCGGRLCIGCCMLAKGKAAEQPAEGNGKP